MLFYKLQIIKIFKIALFIDFFINLCFFLKIIDIYGFFEKSEILVVFRGLKKGSKKGLFGGIL